MVTGVVLAAALVIAAPGCTQSGAKTSMMNKEVPVEKVSTGASGMKTGSMAASSSADPNAQQCADCAGKGMAPMVEGTTTMANGTQVIAIGVKDGYYNPNQFKAAAGSPITVTFSGKTKGCLGKPQFKSLGKNVDFNTSGSATIELGTLQPGTYEFACGMGMTGGKIVVQ
jgi:plastocyanin